MPASKRFLTRVFGQALPLLLSALVLSLGVGASTAAFTLLKTTLLDMVPYPESHKLFLIRGQDVESGETGFDLPATDLREYRQRSHSFQAIEAWQPTPLNLVIAGGDPTQVSGMRSSAGLSSLLGARAVAGRLFVPEDFRPSAERVAVIGYGLCMRFFAGAEEAVGTPLQLDGQPVTIVGVMAPAFRFPETAELWVPLVLQRLDRPTEGARILAKLREGISRESANREVRGISHSLASEQPESHQGRTAFLGRLHAQRIEELEPAFMALNGAAFLVLLIACFNVANLTLVRVQSQRKDMAIRRALGAGRLAAATPQILEGVAIGVGTLAGGLLLASQFTHLLSLWLADRLPPTAELTVDPEVLAFALLLSTVSVFLAIAVPAWRNLAVNPIDALRANTSERSGSRGFLRLRGALAALQVAIGVVLIIAASLLAVSMWNFRASDPGFETEGVTVFEIRLAEYKYTDGSTRLAFFERVLSRVRSLSDISASLSSNVPFLGNRTIFFRLRRSSDDEPFEIAHAAFVSDDYWRTMNIRRVAGRLIERRDLRTGSSGAAVVSEGFLRHYKQDGIGLGGNVYIGAEPYRIVGVVPDVKQVALDRSGSGPMIYLPFTRFPRGRMFLLTRSPRSAAAQVRQAIWEIDAEQPIARAVPLARALGRSYGDIRTYAWLLALFSAIAIILAVVGVYAVISYTSRQRMREFAVRAALGADRPAIVRMVLVGSSQLALAGVVVGLICSVGLTRFLSSLLFGVKALDWAVLCTSALALFLVVVTASLFPACRAASTDPNVVLRAE